MNRLLLDTHIILWALTQPSQLSVAAQQAIDQARTLYVSSASIWEISIKSALGKISVDLDELLAMLEQAGILELPVTWQHARAVAQLEPYHRDPFDRLLIAQAVTEGVPLLTHDQAFRQYQQKMIKIV